MSEKTILILDSTQISDFLECPTLWYYKHVKRLGPIVQSPNVPLNEGSYGHKLLEIIYKERAKGNGKNAIDLAFAYDIDKMTCRCGHGQEHHITVQDYSEEKERLETFTSCISSGCKCLNFHGIEFPLTRPEREFVKQRVLEYSFVEGTSIPELIPTSPDHVEVGFSEKIYEDSERLYVLEGRIDLLGQIANNCTEGWADHKFQSRERDLYLKSIQFRNYSMVTKLGLGVVNYIRFAKKIEKDKTFKRSVISFSKIEMDLWKDQLLMIYYNIEDALRLFQLSETTPDQLRNWGACSGKFGYHCDYTKLCENFYNPELIKIQEQQEFKERPEWKPW